MKDRDRQQGRGREDAERSYHEADGDVVSRKANVDRVPLHGVREVVAVAPCASNDAERVLYFAPT